MRRVNYKTELKCTKVPVRMDDIQFGCSGYDHLAAGSVVCLDVSSITCMGTDTKTVINVQNRKDNKCFRHTVVAGLYRPSDPTHSTRISSYEYCKGEDDFPDFSMLSYPVPLKDIAKVNNISVNVYSIAESKERKRRKIVMMRVTKGGGGGAETKNPSSRKCL